MIKLSESISFMELYNTCMIGITGNINLLNLLKNARADINILDTDYRKKGGIGELYKIAPIKKCSSKKKYKRLKKINSVRKRINRQFKRKKTNYNPVVYGGIKKQEFISLYETYFVNKDKKNARAIYDKILASAKQKCSYCCGVGKPRNLDHYLPKAYFPQFSILPLNLVPCCRDCNMDAKSDSVVFRENEQLLHPFLDKKHFFDEQWVDIEFQSKTLNENTSFIYVTNPPETWNSIDKSRAINHFKTCDLGVRFAKDAVDTFINIYSQIEQLKKHGISNDMIVSCVLNPILENPNRDVNHWEMVLIKGVKRDFFNGVL